MTRRGYGKRGNDLIIAVIILAAVLIPSFIAIYRFGVDGTTITEIRSR